MSGRNSLNPGAMPLSARRPLKPILVTGSGRSGTTAVARILAAGGMSHFWDPDSLNAETLEDILAWEGRGNPEAIAEIRQRRGEGPWLYKKPLVLHKMRGNSALVPLVDSDLVVVCRDPVAEARYDGADRERAILSRARLAAQQIEFAIQLAGRWGVMFLSYDLMKDPDNLPVMVKALFKWAGLSTRSDNVERGVGQFVPGDPRYHGADR